VSLKLKSNKEYIMLNAILNTEKKTPAKKAPAKKKAAPKKAAKKEEVQAPAIMAQPGTYNREAGLLFLCDDFKKETTLPLVMAITEYNMMPEELSPDRITIMINSPGGRVDSCLMLIDAMKTSSIPVDTFCTGLAASCGILTLMAGVHRMASSTAQIMSHQYAAGSSGKEHELYGRVKSFEHTSDWMETHYAECTGLSVKKIRKHLLGPTDVWLDANEALSYNIIDQVVNPYKD
jgi:ATP-dependent Clp protease protease subunit